MDTQPARRGNRASESCLLTSRRDCRQGRGRQPPGQSLVEFALVISALLIVFLGVLDLGRAFHSYIIITNSAREGARYGSMHPDEETEIKNRVLAEAYNSGIALSADDVDVYPGGASGSATRVEVQYDFSLLTAWLVGRQTLQLRSAAEMVTY